MHELGLDHQKCQMSNALFIVVVHLATKLRDDITLKLIIFKGRTSRNRFLSILAMTEGRTQIHLSKQPRTQAFSFRALHLARIFVTSPNGMSSEREENAWVLGRFQ